MPQQGIRFFVTAALSFAFCFLAGCGKDGSTAGKKDQGGAGGGEGGGACKNVDICALIPMAEINRSLAGSATNANPETLGDDPSGQAMDECSYLGAKPTTTVVLRRHCYPEATLATSTYEGSRQDSLPKEGTRTEVTGLGDRAFYEIKPTVADISLGENVTAVRLIVLKGNVYVTLTDAPVPAAQAAKVKAGLTAFASTILGAK
jgi:hypothetical protein